MRQLRELELKRAQERLDAGRPVTRSRDPPSDRGSRSSGTTTGRCRRSRALAASRARRRRRRHRRAEAGAAAGNELDADAGRRGRARGLGLPLAEVETVRAGPGSRARSPQRGPDVLVVVAYGELLPRDRARTCPAIAPVNLHFSLLPALRGASPVQTALLLGLERTGVSTIVMDAGPRHRSGAPAAGGADRGREDDAGIARRRGSPAIGARAPRRRRVDLTSPRVPPTRGPQDDAARDLRAEAPGPRTACSTGRTRPRSLVNLAAGRCRPSPGRPPRSGATGLKVLRAEAVDGDGRARERSSRSSTRRVRRRDRRGRAPPARRSRRPDAGACRARTS